MADPLKIKLPAFNGEYEFNIYPINIDPPSASGVFVAVKFIDPTKTIAYLGAGHLDNFKELVSDNSLVTQLNSLDPSPSHLLFYETDDLKLKNAMVYLLTKGGGVARISNYL